MEFHTTQKEQRQVESGGKTQFLFLLPIFLWVIIMPLFMTTEEMWLTGIEISVVVILVVFLCGQYLNRRQARVERVVSEYLSRFRSGNFTNGLDALLKSGACELSNRFELNEVCRKICKRAKSGQHPNSAEKVLLNRRMLAFLNFCQKNHQDISSGSDTLVVILQFNGEIEK